MNLKIYKLTLYVSTIILVSLTALSIVLNIWSECNQWIVFVVNWCVGIACSIAVVVITTFIQFKVEQGKIINEIASAVRTMLFHNDLYGGIFVNDVERNADTVKELNKFEAKWRNAFKEDVNQLRSLQTELDFLFKKKQNWNLLRSILTLRIAQFDNSGEDYEKEAESLKKEFLQVKGKIIDLAEIIISFKINKYTKEEIEKYICEYKKVISNC